MQILKEIEHNKISQIISSIQKSPESWEGWTCLYLDAPIFLSSEEYDEISSEIDSMINKRLDDFKGTVYISDNKNIVVLCKNIDELKLQKLAIELMYIYKRISLSEVNYKTFKMPELTSDLVSYHIDIKLKEIDEKGAFQAQSDKQGEGQLVKSILVVDDDPLTCKMIFNSLHNKHYIIVANDGEQALKEFYKTEPDLILLDINMPKMDGVEVLNSIIKTNPNSKVVMFSGNDDAESISTCINGGASGFISKPFNRDKVQSYINSLV